MTSEKVAVTTTVSVPLSTLSPSLSVKITVGITVSIVNGILVEAVYALPDKSLALWMLKL